MSDARAAMLWRRHVGATIDPLADSCDRRKVATRRAGIACAMLAAAFAIGACSGSAHPGAPPVLPVAPMLVGQPDASTGSAYYAPCQQSFFVSACRLASASAGINLNAPFGQEFILEFASSRDASAAEKAQLTTELSTGWMCAVESQCPVTPLHMADVGAPVTAVSFRLGARGNLSETNCLASVRKGRFVVTVAWISASGVSAQRVSSSAVVEAFLHTALGKVPG
jgi:hypothetical protein